MDHMQRETFHCDGDGESGVHTRRMRYGVAAETDLRFDLAS